MAARAEDHLEHALRDLAAALNATGAPWMIIGGIAVLARGVRRFTADIDAAVRGDAIAIPTLLAALAKKRIVPRIARAEAFARESLVLLLRHAPTGVELDVTFAWTEFEHAAIAAAVVTSFGSARAPMARAEDLIVFKAIAGRGKDLDDAIALLTLYPALDLAAIRARVRELADAADAPELVGGLEAAIVTARKLRPVTRASAPTRAGTPTPRATPARQPRRRARATPRKRPTTTRPVRAGTSSKKKPPRRRRRQPGRNVA